MFLSGRLPPTLALLLLAPTVFVTTNAAEVPAPAGVASAGKLVFCTELASPPWDMLDPATQQPTGFDIDIAAALAAEMGVTSEHKNITFDGLIPALQASQCDAVISCMYDKPERREIVDFVHYAITGTSPILRADSTLEIASLEDFSGKKVSVGIGSTGENLLAEANASLAAKGKPPIEVVVLQTSNEAFQQLMAGLVEAYMGATDQAAYFNNVTPNSVKLGGEALNSYQVGIATLKANAELHDAMAQAFENIKANGTYDEILDKWSFKDLSI